VTLLETETVGAVEVPGGHPIFQVGEAPYRLVEDRIEPKVVLVFSATPSPFEADGVAECTIRLTPAPVAPLLVQVGDETLEVTPEDPDILLTADTPQVIPISLVLDLVYWAAPITAEAV
jgi:hypothetical protein